ncbi:anti-sigma factor [Paraburkholderia sp. GAS334]|uniref:anti-sigma factor n=1 Tax=Paraburkholderia sp. GAS334 TaxID=3035131 RepID=UPI003D1BA9E7
MDLHRYPETVDMLAAEYVVGTLRGGARRRLQRYAEHDSAIRRAVSDWENRLAPIAGLAPARMPPARVWQAIEEQLGFAARRQLEARAAEAARPEPRSWFDNLAFWRGWAIGITALAAIALVLAVRGLLPPGPTQPAQPPTVAQQPVPAISHVAVLSNKDAQAVMLISWDSAHSSVKLHRLSDAAPPSGKTMQLWGLPANGHPVSLGVMPDHGDATMPAGQQQPQQYPALAVSIEPSGGSPDPDGPTGPVVFSGKLLPVS